MLIYQTNNALLVARQVIGPWRRFTDLRWDGLFDGSLTKADLNRRFDSGEGEAIQSLPELDLLPPIGSQEVWAAGVTYLRSRTARMEESASSGGSTFYDLVYNAHRPELFFKATPHRVVGHGKALSLRTDSTWMVPEPEATLAFSRDGKLVGFTIGNDLSSRDIEGQNPLYLPQAKVFNGCCGLGPALYLTDELPPPTTTIDITIERNGEKVFSGSTSTGQMKQPFENLREHLFRDNSFPNGCYLMTGTGIVPPDNFTLQSGDRISISIPPVGTLVNSIA